MKNTFYIYAVLATLMQNSLVTLTPTSSCTTNTGTQMMADYYTTGVLKSQANFEYQKAVDIFFSHLEDLAGVACGRKNPPQGSSRTTEVYETQMIAHFMAQLNLSLSATKIINSKAESQIPAGLKTGSTVIRKFVRSLSAGIKSALSENCAENRAKIKALENATFAEPAVYTGAFYGALQYGQSNPPKIKAAIKIAKEQSMGQFMITIQSFFRGLEALQFAVMSEGHDECEHAMCEIKSARDQASIALRTEVENKFDLIQKLLKYSSIIQSGITTDSSTIETIRMASASDYEKAMNSIHTTMQNGPSNVPPRNNNRMTDECEAIENAEEEANANIQNGLSAIFHRLEVESNTLDGDSHCESVHDYSATETASNEDYIDFKNGIDKYFEAILITQPGASKVVTRGRHAAHAALFKLTESIKASINLARNNYSTDIPAQIAANEKVTLSATVALNDHVFSSIRNGRKFQTQIETEFERAREMADDLLVELFRIVFIGIEMFLVKVFPEYEMSCEDCFPSIEAAPSETSALFSEKIEIVFNTIRMVSGVCSGDQIQTVDNSCTYAAA